MKYLIFLAVLFASCQNPEKPQQGVSETQAAAQKAESSGAKASTAKKNILFFGNSLTAGYGLDNLDDAWVSLLQRRIDSLGLPYRCVNAGLSGETTAGGDARVAWILDQQPIDIFVLELGGNDALRGIKPASSSSNLQSIISKVRAKYPSAEIVLAGMESPRNMGKDYARAFHEIYPDLAKRNKLKCIPFILENVGGIAELNQKDGIHPSVEGNRVVAETVWAVLKTVITN
jgi:acyl-CoA thioesterase I